MDGYFAVKKSSIDQRHQRLFYNVVGGLKNGTCRNEHKKTTK